MPRSTWDELPATARAAIEREAGLVARAEIPSAGRNSDFSATLHLCSGGVVFCKGIADAEGKRGAVASHDVLWIPGEIGPEFFEGPHFFFKRNSGNSSPPPGKFAVREGITRHINNLVCNSGFGEQDFGSQLSDIVRCGNGYLGLPAPKCMNLAVFEIHHTKCGLKEETHEHAGGNNHPFGSVLPPEHLPNLILFVEHRLAASPAHDVIVYPELPREIAIDFRLQNSPGDS